MGGENPQGFSTPGGIMLYEIKTATLLCPYCERHITPWHEHTDKTVEVNGSVYHKACIIGLQPKDMVDGKWKKQKTPSRPRSVATTVDGTTES